MGPHTLYGRRPPSDVAMTATWHRYSSLVEEAESKSRKLKQLWSKFRAAQSEIDDLQAEQQQEKADLLHTVRELTRQVRAVTATTEGQAHGDPIPPSHTPCPI